MVVGGCQGDITTNALPRQMISRSGNTCQSLSKHNKSHAPLLSLEWPHRRTGYYSHSGGQMWSGIVSLQCMHLDQQDNSVPYQLLLYICITILKNTTLQLHLTVAGSQSVVQGTFEDPWGVYRGSVARCQSVVRGPLGVPELFSRGSIPGFQNVVRGSLRGFRVSPQNLARFNS